jgi:glycosyltransferase involved in cell wall biosynthesis
VNICYISHVDISLPNGPGVNEREFLLALREESMLRGDRASCIIPRPSLPLDAPLPDAHFFRPSIPVSRFPSLNRLLANVQLARLIIGLNWRHDYDLHILRLSRTGLFIPVLLRLLGKPYGIKTLGNTKKFNRAGRRPWNERIVTLLFRRILRDSLATDVCTPQLEEYYRSGYGVDNIQVVDNAVNVERFFPLDKYDCRETCGLGEFDRIVGYCGGRPSERGARQLVDIAPRLMERYPRAGIVIIGEDQDLDTLKMKARDHGLSARVRFMGTIPYTELNPFMNCFDVGVALDTAQRIDVIGNSSQKIRQFIACGVPVVCAGNTNTWLIREKLGSWVDPDDAEQLFHEICSWFDLPEDMKNLFRDRARRYAVDNLSTRMAYEKRYRAWKKALPD